MRALVALLLPMTALADPPTDFLRSYTETRGYMLGRPVAARPTPDGKAVLFLRSTARSPELSLWEYQVAGGAARELITPQEILRGASEHLSAEERARRERQRVTLRGFTAFDLSDDGALLLVTLSGRLYTVRRGDGKVTALATGEGVIDPKLSPDGKRVAYVRDRDLYVLDLDGAGHERRLTTSNDPHVTNGLAEFVAQEEMFRFTGYWWSPDGKSLAYEEADTRGVETFQLADPARPDEPPHPVPYPRPGKANAAVRLAVIAAGGGKPAFVEWDRARFPYLATVSWGAGGPLTLLVQSRDQRDEELLAADAHGKTHRLLAEHDDAWLNLDQTVPRWLSDGSGFLWSSERGGAWALELRDAKGALLRTLATDEGWGGLLHVDEQARAAYYAGSPEPSEDHLFRVSLDGGAPVKLTSEPGVHAATFARRAPVWVLSSTTLASMPRHTVHTVEGVSGELPSVAEAPPASHWPHAELLTVGPRKLRVMVSRPRDFDPHKKYPVIVAVYGGPHHRQVTRAMQPLLLRQWLADHGYLVVAVDGRGTPRRGRAWERAIRGDFAGPTLDDQVAALDALAARLPEMDERRVGIYGWSFGGYMAALAVLRRPDRFRVGVAGAPVVDWMDYDTHYTERYLGLPADDAEGYRRSSLLTWAASLERPLLLIHGTSDDNVYFLHSLKLADALFRAGRRFDFLPLSGFTHMVPDPVVNERLQTRILDALAAGLREVK